MHFNAFKHFREEERYEVGLASGRLSSLLASQAFLFTGWAIIHGQTGANSPKLVLITIPAVAFSICLISFLAIFVAVIVIGRWQRHGARLVSDDQRDTSPPDLMDFHLNREPCDWYHKLGVSVFSLSIPLLFMFLRAIVFAHSVGISSSQANTTSESPVVVAPP